MSETPMTPERRAAVAELIGSAEPATDHLLLEIAQQIRDRREHDHSSAADWDWFCLNASGWLGDKAPTVLRRLLDAEARIAELEAGRHTTNQALSEADEALRRQRDRIEKQRVQLAAERIPYRERAKRETSPTRRAAWLQLARAEESEARLELLLAAPADDDPEAGACAECGDSPSTWCVGCAKCSCEPKHDKGCDAAGGAS